MLNLLKSRKARIILVSIALLVGFAIIFTSIGINRYVKEGAYVKVGNHNVSKIEYNFYKNLYIDTFEAQYAEYLEALGIDGEQDYSNQPCLMYEDITWGEYFEGRALQLIQEIYILYDDCIENDYKVDTDSLYDDFIDKTAKNAVENQVSLDEYLSQRYAEGANKRNFKDIYCKYMLTGKYRDEKKKTFSPSNSDIDAYYEKNRNDLDLVTYRDFIFAPDYGDSKGGNQQITEEEAMKAAKEQAEKMFSNIHNQETFLEQCVKFGGKTKEEYESSTLYKDKALSSVHPAISEWVFDVKRENNSVAVIEDNTNKQYHVVFFINREKNTSPTVNFRNILIKNSIAGATSDEAIKSAKDKADDVVAEYEKTEKTEADFIELVRKYSEDNDSLGNDGLYSEVLSEKLSEKASDWLFDSIRTAGDYTTIYSEKSGYYILYYISPGDPSWRVSAKNSLVEERYKKFIDDNRKDYEISDVRGEVEYLRLATQDQAEIFEND